MTHYFVAANAVAIAITIVLRMKFYIPVLKQEVNKTLP